LSAGIVPRPHWIVPMTAHSKWSGVLIILFSCRWVTQLFQFLQLDLNLWLLRDLFRWPSRLGGVVPKNLFHLICSLVRDETGGSCMETYRIYFAYNYCYQCS
jgi:hypothetical protein